MAEPRAFAIIVAVVMRFAIPISLSWLSTVAPGGWILLPLMLVSSAIVTLIPVAARRGKLHIPAYVGITVLSFGVGLLFGRVAGMRGVVGTSFGAILSIVFFSLMAAAVGSVLALFFYRDPPEI